MRYKGYSARVEFDDEAALFHGEVEGTRDVITFQGTSVEELTEAFRGSVDDYLDWCAERGKEPEAPYSGPFAVSLDAALHRAAGDAARRGGKSLEAWVAERVAEAAVKA